MDEFKQKMESMCGPGGLHCECCNKYRGKRDKKKLTRRARRTLKSEDITKINKELDTPTE